MNQTLVTCLIFSIVAAGLSAAIVVAAGWGWLVGFLVYSLSGASTLILSALWAFRDAPDPEPQHHALARLDATRPGRATV